MVDIPGMSGFQAKADFLFNRDGVGMQGSGIMTCEGKAVYIGYDRGHWEDSSGRRVYITRQGWVYEDGSLVKELASIHLTNALFSMRAPSNKIPRFSLAGPPDFSIGSILFSPKLSGLTPYNGLLRVEDRGGAFKRGELRFDMYQGIGNDAGLAWLEISERSNVDVYLLILPLEVYNDKR